MSSEPGAQVRQVAIDQLKQEGSQLWSELKQLHLSVNNERQPVPLDAANPEQTIDAVREKRLQAEIDAVANEEVQELSTNPEVLYELLNDDLSKSVHQLKETLIYANTEIEMVDQSIASEEEYLNRHEMLGKALDKKLEDLNGVKEQSQASILKKYGERQQKMTTYLRQITKKMALFVNENYPVPDEVTTAASRKRHSSGPSARDAARKEPYIPMLKLIEMLLNLCIDSPFDPYVDITDNLWPPHIELLLRYQLVTRHPEIESKIKLTPFHL
ncbi:centromere protein K-like [Lineus longissimus]|uniref:centromere protein K-like n=1 Tax=Lineus longissimus TaxID=88925 RepID=UPI002B4D5D28